MDISLFVKLVDEQQECDDRLEYADGNRNEFVCSHEYSPSRGLNLTLHFVPSCPSYIGGKMMRNVQGAQ